MTRKKVNLQWIAHDLTRRATFKKRCAALMKKTHELSTLCGIKACAVVYEADAAQPEVYPSVPEARRLLKSYKAIPDELEKLKKVLSMEEYLRSRISKLHEQISKPNLKKHEDRALYLLHEAMDGRLPGLVSLTNEELDSLEWVVESKMKSTKERFKQLGVKEPLPPLEEGPTLASQQQAPCTYTDMETMALVEETQAQQQEWFADFTQNGGELGSVVYGDLGTSSGGAGPSSSGAGIVNTMQHYNMWSSGFSSGSWDPFPTME